MKKINNPQDIPFWYAHTRKTPKKLTHSFKTDVVIVGGGLAGITAAQKFKEKGFSVVLLERHFCGSGATGKSTGFITADSELDLGYMARVFGPDKARTLWEFLLGGLHLIEDNIKKYDLKCDYRKEKTLVVANSRHTFKIVQQEHETRKQFNYESELHDAQGVSNILGSSNYYGGVSYGGTFGINPYLYMQGMKDVLVGHGVDVYEETPVTEIKSHSVISQGVEIHADRIVVCVDYKTASLQKLKTELYHAQTFVMMSAPLTDKQIQHIFPNDMYMVWDTDLVYQYYRLVQDNRLVMGGASMFSSFWPYERHNASGIYRKLNRYMKHKFPQVDLDFQYMWPGLIGVSKDIMPIAGFDERNESIYYLAGVAGLTWAAALGNYCVERIIDNKDYLDDIFSPTRNFPLPGFAQYIIGKPATFAISNFISLVVKRALCRR